MLVSKKQGWELYPEQQEQEKVEQTPKPQLDAPLRKRCLGIAVLLTFMAIAITVQSEWIVRSGYDLVQMKKHVVSLEKENEILHLDIAKLKSPGRIERIATHELGLVQPSSVYYAASSSAIPAVTETKQKTSDSLLSSGKAEASQPVRR